MSDLKNRTRLLDEWFSLNEALDKVPLCNNDSDSITSFCWIVHGILHKCGPSNEQYIFRSIIYKLDEDIMQFTPKCFARYHNSVEELLQDLLTISYDDSQKRDTESKDEDQDLDDDEDSDDDDFTEKIGFPFENFTPRVFIFQINNKEKKDLPLWKIENRNTVQRYISFEKEGKTYKSSAIYAHFFFFFWNRDVYLGVRVAFILQGKEETIVEIINNDAVSISVPSLAPQTSMACSAPSTETKL